MYSYANDSVLKSNCQYIWDFAKIRTYGNFRQTRFPSDSGMSYSADWKGIISLICPSILRSWRSVPGCWLWWVGVVPLAPGRYYFGWHHGFSCKKSAGRIVHRIINDIIRRAHSIVLEMVVLESYGLALDDGKRPNVMTIMPWKML